jgi:hypothetical protein
MADWEKVEQTLEQDAQGKKKPASVKEEGEKPVEKKAEKAAKKAKKTAQKEKKRKEKLIAYGKKMQEKEAEKNARVDKKGRRKGRYNWAAPLGLVMTVFAIIGMIATVSVATDFVKTLTDDTALKQELTYALQPLTTYNPVPSFDETNREEVDELLRAAVWRITDAERIRMLREKDDNTAYELDNNGRLIVPVAEVEASYRYLFGDDAVLKNRTLGEEEDLEYSEGNNCYYVPFTFVNSLHQPVIDTVKNRGGQYHVRVAYVSVNELQVDERGNTLAPTPEMASFAQIFVVKKINGRFVITAVGEEG